jgi:LemA protein
MNNKGCLISLGVAVALILIVVMTLVGKYNSIVTLEEGCDLAWANVETVLQRRYDLIPNVVNTVKGFADHEKELLTEVTRLRSQWGEAKAAGDTAGSVKAAGMLEGALGRLMVVVEKYPDLKSNQNFLALQEELAGTENRISVERRRYNEAVARYNAIIRRFPANLVAGIAGAERRSLFEATAGASEAPTVEF